MLRVTGQVCSFENLVTHLVFVTYASKSQKTNWFQQKRLIRVKMILKFRISCSKNRFRIKSSIHHYIFEVILRKNLVKIAKIENWIFAPKIFAVWIFQRNFYHFWREHSNEKCFKKCLNFHAKNNCNLNNFWRENSGKNASKILNIHD